nr:NAD-dependent epimerase/dehydratase family protein [Streptomyces sp. AA4]
MIPRPPGRGLVTGGAGFIGSHLATQLLRAPDVAQVTVLDALTYAGHPDNLAHHADQRPGHADLARRGVVRGGRKRRGLRKRLSGVLRSRVRRRGRSGPGAAGAAGRRRPGHNPWWERNGERRRGV